MFFLEDYEKKTREYEEQKRKMEQLRRQREEQAQIIRQYQHLLTAGFPSVRVRTAASITDTPSMPSCRAIVNAIPVPGIRRANTAM